MTILTLHYKKTVYFRRINFDGYKFVGNLFFPTDLPTVILCEHYRRTNPSVACILKFFIYLPTDRSVGKFPSDCALIYRRNLILYRRIISFGNFLAEIKIEFRSSPNSVSLKTQRRRRRCRETKVQTSVVARATSKVFRFKVLPRAGATLQQWVCPSLAVTFVGAAQSTAGSSVRVLRRGHRRSGVVWCRATRFPIGLHRCHAATVSMPWAVLWFTISVSVLRRSHWRSGNWHSSFDFFMSLHILIVVM